MKTVEQILLISALVMVIGCAFHRQSNITLTNVEYQGSKGDLHYIANTEMCFGLCPKENDNVPVITATNIGPTTNTSK